MNKKVAILGAATGYAPEKIKTFIESLIYVGFTGDVVLFVNQSQIENYKKFYKQNYSFTIKYQVTNIGEFLSSKKMHNEVKKAIKKLSSVVVLFNSYWKERFIHYLSFPHVSRFFDYRNYLKTTDSISHVILTDTRDVIFQKNPDHFFEKDGLYLGMEDTSNPIGKDSFHIKWITDVYGKAYLEEVAEKQISCAGVTMGDFQSIDAYLDTMVHEFLDLPYYLMVKSNYDQGIHNKLLYSDAFNDTILCQPFDSCISTIGTLMKEEILLNTDGNILNKDGTIADIVHQYDRHPELEKLIVEKYSQVDDL